MLDVSRLGLVGFECDIKGNIYHSSNAPATSQIVERLSSYWGAEFQSRYVKGVPFLNKRCVKGVPFLPKWYKKGKGLDLGQSLAVLNFVNYPPPPLQGVNT